ncbi:MAG: hypothetical protein H0W06_05455, partial [Chloroflexia bacterium]|nr:hypothetical protein [Chloroflexia bacterium]
MASSATPRFQLPTALIEDRANQGRLPPMLDVQTSTDSTPENRLPDPRRYAAGASRLPLKVRWSLVAWLRASGALDEAVAVLDDIEAERGTTGT